MRRKLLEDRVEALGRFVYFDGVELAHCPDDRSAELIALAIKYVGLPDSQIPHDDNARLVGLLA